MACVVVAIGFGCSGSRRPPRILAPQYEGPIASRDTEEGRRIFTTLCAACHAGRVNPHGLHWSAAQMRQQIREGNRLMPPLPEVVLTQEQVEAVLAYLAVEGSLDGELPTLRGDGRAHGLRSPNEEERECALRAGCRVRARDTDAGGADAGLEAGDARLGGPRLHGSTLAGDAGLGPRLGDAGVSDSGVDAGIGDAGLDAGIGAGIGDAGTGTGVGDAGVGDAGVGDAGGGDVDAGSGDRSDDEADEEPPESGDYLDPPI